MKNKIIFKTLMLKGEAGSTIVSMEKTGHVGTADIYTITFNDGSTTEISLENMSAITSVEKTSSTDTEDIYTITCADGSTQTFSVLNHNDDIAAMSDDIDTIDARVDNFINSVVPNTVETLWTGSISQKNDSATLSKAVSNFDYIDLYLLGSADSKYIRVPATQTAVQIQQQNMSDDASSNFLRLWEMGVSISGTTVSINKAIAWAWDDPDNSHPTATADAQNALPITRIDGVKVASDTPAEVTDIRVGANGVTYGSAGDAVRGQYNDLDDRFDSETHVSSNLLNPANINAGYYWTDGWHSSGSYVNTGLIPCEYGKDYTVQKGYLHDAANRSIDTARFIVFYGSDGTTVVDSGSYVSTITPPNGASYFITSYNVTSVDAYKAVNPMAVVGTTVVDYEAYFAPYTTHILKSANNNAQYINSLIDIKLAESRPIKNGLVNEFDISSDNHGTTEELQDMFGYSIMFRGTVTTFNGITIAHGYGQAMGGYVKITPTTFEYYLGTEESPRLSEAHNLTIKDYIAVRIDAKPNIYADFTVYTNGGVYTKTNQTWDVRKGQLSVRSDGTNVLTDCVLSYNCEGWSKPIHLYGDSYFGVYSDKWTKYLVDAGFTDNLLNGYPGRQSAMALLVAKIVLANSSPEKIVWCLGMNDGDDDGAVDASWKACVDELMEICDARNIELILATIPNVPSVDNTYKNAYVIASGRRYIDFASAVGASSGTTWYDNMLSSDMVHPDIQGAIALFNQAIADVPELMQ